MMLIMVVMVKLNMIITVDNDDENYNREVFMLI